jgi:hypothetical protein
MDKSNVWGPKYWYVLHMMAFHYPKHPNKVTKKKYYEMIMNFPLFIPHPEMGNKFSGLLDKYPVTPYLDSRESFIKWTHFIHNRVNDGLGKPRLSYAKFINMYMNPPEINESTSSSSMEWIKKNSSALSVSAMVIIITLIYKLL